MVYNIDGHKKIVNKKYSDIIDKNFPLSIDSNFYGNLSRFINHSCDPNLKAINFH